MNVRPATILERTALAQKRGGSGGGTGGTGDAGPPPVTGTGGGITGPLGNTGCGGPTLICGEPAEPGPQRGP